MKNPFTPTFGIVPPYLAGRDKIISDMERAFNNWPGDPNLSSILIGPRGSGKTALLAYIGDIAMRSGWVVADTVCAENMLEDIFQRSMMVAEEHIDTDSKKRLSGISVGQIGLSWENDKANSPANWRTRISQVINELNKQEIGLLITVDEVRGDVNEMVQLVSVYQLLIRENAKIALIMAGLPVYINNLISNDIVSFLRRSRQHFLLNIPDAEIRYTLKRTIENAEKTIEPDALDMAVAEISGFAYMMQLVGYSVWEESGEDILIDVENAKQGIANARNDFKTGVLNSTYRELSSGDKMFLFAMLEDAEYSTLSKIAARMGKSPGYASTYKTRLLHAGVIEEDAGKTISFALPGFREYLKDQKKIYKSI